jgi:lipopolysaccharide export system protein LptC
MRPPARWTPGEPALNAQAAPPELHLPDLPEVSVKLGPAPPQPGAPRLHEHWGSWLRNQVSSYLPLLLMLALALTTWWLVKSTPRAPQAAGPQAKRSEPDYEMARFAITRFAADGRARVHLEGERLRHLPDVDRMEIDTVHIRARSPDGREMRATAQRALANGDASQVQLLGGAKVQAELSDGSVLEVESEFLQADLATERLSTDRQVRVTQGRSQATAAGLEADNLRQRVQFTGPVRIVFHAPQGKPAP